jgi:hypothetical protein
MGREVEHPDDLDWIARGRDRESSQGRFSTSVSESEVAEMARERLVSAIATRLTERESAEQSETRVRKAAQQIFDSVGTEERRRIEEATWNDLDSASLDGKTIMQEYRSRVASRIIERWLAERGDEHPTSGRDRRSSGLG